MLELINKTGDVNNIPEEQLDELAKEIRRFLIKSISRTGGHLASNLGVVELTIALHRVFDPEKDKLIWDVGHQCYTHKILTGRKNEFARLRKKGGISGFPRREESECDCYDTGHSSNSISAGLGFATARELTGEDYKVVSIIGDGALTGGEAFEAMNNACALKKNFIVVLNDNNMSISKNVGGISNYLNRIRTSKVYTELKMSVSTALEKVPRYGAKMVNNIRRAKTSLKALIIPGMFFEDMGFTYLGPVDGHNIAQMEMVLEEAAGFEGPILVHVITQKGKGYKPARNNPERFHGTPSFTVNDGRPVRRNRTGFSDIFAEKLIELAEDDSRITAITAAMKEGTGLKKFQKMFPERFFDVGIAEQHAVSFAAAQALSGLRPVVAIYSSFLQRAYDQILLDVCAQNAPVVFAVDRSGFVGEDGKTHQGCYDISFLSMMPNMIVMAPKDADELKAMLEFAMNYDGPTAVRYSKGEVCERFSARPVVPVEFQKAEMIRSGRDIAIFAEGSMTGEADILCDMLEEKGYAPTLVNARFIKPFDEDMIRSLCKEHRLLLTVEDGIRSGGLGERILDFVNEQRLDIVVRTAAVRNGFTSHGTIKEQLEENGLDAASLMEMLIRDLN